MRNIKRIFTIGLAFLLMLCMSSCKWIENWVKDRSNRSYTIHFNANGGTGEMEDFFVESGDEGLLPNCTFTKEGYECLAWSTDKDGENCYSYIQKLTFLLPSSIKSGDTVELYAVWTTPGFTFNVNGMGFDYFANITDYEGTANTIIMPKFLSGYNIRNVSNGLFAEHTEIESVINFPSKDIPAQCFYGCTSLKSIIQKNGDLIGCVEEQAFYNCIALQEIQFSNVSKVEIGKEAFYGCTSIKKLVIPQTIEKIEANAFYGWTEDQTIEFLWHDENIFGEEWLNGCSAKIVWKA